jgi:hypothetical protein
VPPLEGKHTGRNTKLYDDADAAQALLDQRPASPAIPATEEGIDALATEIGGIVKTAAGQGVELRGKVGFPTTPHSLVWLREAQEFVSRLSGKKKIELADKQAAAIRFLDRELRIRKGEGNSVKAERNAEGEAAMAARGKGKGKVTEQTQAGDIVAGPAKLNVPTEKREVVQAGGLIKRKDVAKAFTREVSPEARAEIEARTAAESIEAVKKKAAEAAKPKPLPPTVAEKVEATKAKTAAKKQAQKEALPSKVREKKPLTVKVTPEAVAKAKAVAEAKKAPPKPSGKAALGSELAKVEPNPSNAQIEADNASKGHIPLEGMQVAVSTAAKTERHLVLPSGSRVSRLYNYSYGHILGTKAPDGKPIDIFLGPEAYPGNPKLEGLPVVVIDQVDPDTKAPDEPKVMYGFSKVTDAVEAYKDSYPRGDERVGDVVPMTPNEFKQWRRSKEEIKNADETAGEPVSELEALIEEQATDAASQDELDTIDDGSVPPVPFSDEDMEDASQAKENAAKRELIAAASAVRSGRFSDFVGEATDAYQNFSWYKPITRSIFRRFLQQINSLASDVPVYVVPDTVYENDLGKGFGTAAFYSPHGNFIAIKESHANFSAFNTGASQLLLHEGVHAAFTKAIYANQKMLDLVNDVYHEAVANSTRWTFPSRRAQYGLTNVDEFIAEAISNRDFQKFLANIKATPYLIEKLGLTKSRPRSMWDVFTRMVGKALRLSPVHDTLLGAAMKVSSQLELASIGIGQGVPSDLRSASIRSGKRTGVVADLGELESRLPEALTDRLPSKVNALLGTTANIQPQQGTPWALGIRTMDQVVQLAKGFNTKFYEHLRKAADIVEMIRTTADRYLNEMKPIIYESHALENKYKGTGLWERFVDLVMTETRVQVYADRLLASQKHLGKNTLRGAQPKAEWAALNAEWQELSNLAPDLMAFRAKSIEFFKEAQNKGTYGHHKELA